MKKTLRRKFIFFAMLAVTVLLVVLIGGINIFSWMLLDRQSDDVLHMIAAGEDNFPQKDFHDRGPFMPKMNADTIKSARFFMVRIDRTGHVLDINLDQISSVTEEQAALYAEQIQDTSGKIEGYKYEVKQLGGDRLIFFVDTASQISTFVMVLSVSTAIAVVCWLLIFLFVVLLSGRVIRPVLAGMEKQKQFITNAGHELKTPLAIIQSNNDASALLCGETKYSRNIRMQTQRLNVLMTNLLTLAKLDEEGALPMENADLSALTGAVLPAYEDEMERKEIVFSADLQPGVFMRVHAATFSQMISILLDNAVKYTPELGTIRLTVRRDGECIRIIEENHCDNPCGDPERLFERFYRGDSARTQDNSSSGYGIGLSAARSIAEAFGGTLKAEYTGEGMLRFVARF